MNFQEKVFETAAEFRARAAKGIQDLKGPLATLKLAGRDLGQVARRHASRFVQENRTIATDAGKDLSALARATLATLSKRAASPVRKRKSAVSRRRAKDKAA